MVSKERRFTKPVGYSKRVREQNLVSIPRAVLDPKVKVSKVTSVVRGKSQLDVFGKLFHFLAEQRHKNSSDTCESRKLLSTILRKSEDRMLVGIFRPLGIICG